MEWRSVLKYAPYVLMAIGALGPGGSARTREIAFTGVLNALLQKKQMEMQEEREKEMQAYREELLELKRRQVDIDEKLGAERLNLARETIELERKRIEETQRAYAQIIGQLQGGSYTKSEVPFQPPHQPGAEEMFPLPHLTVPRAKGEEERLSVPPFDTLF